MQFNLRHRLWPKFVRFCAPIWAKFSQFRKISTNFSVIGSAKMAEIRLKTVECARNAKIG
jgi:hypothetical protein